MTTAQDPTSRWAFFAHHMVTFVVIGVALYALGDLTQNTAVDLLALSFLAAFMVGEFATTRHTGLFCGHCLDRIPTDAAVQAKRRDWALRLTHLTWTYAVRIALAVLAVWIVDLATPGIWFSGYVLWTWWGLEAWAQRFHSRVAPWCPYCRGGGGGHGMSSPTPDPAGVKSR